jgi:type IV pilus assembly protein PilB
MLKKSESSQRVLDEATEEFQIQVLKERRTGEDNLTVERLTSDNSPIIRLVNSTNLHGDPAARERYSHRDAG